MTLSGEQERLARMICTCRDWKLMIGCVSLHGPAEYFKYCPWCGKTLYADPAAFSLPPQRGEPHTGINILRKVWDEPDLAQDWRHCPHCWKVLPLAPAPSERLREAAKLVLNLIEASRYIQFRDDETRDAYVIAREALRAALQEEGKL